MKILKKHVTHGKIPLTVYYTDIEDFNVLYVEAGTTGERDDVDGGKAHSYFSIKDAAGTVMETTKWGKPANGAGFAVRLDGDAELRTMIEALRFVLQVFEGEFDKKKVATSAEEKRLNRKANKLADFIAEALRESGANVMRSSGGLANMTVFGDDCDFVIDVDTI